MKKEDSYEAKIKKGNIGMDPKKLASVLMDDKIRHFIEVEKEGRTDKGYEMNTIIIYSKPWQDIKDGK